MNFALRPTKKWMLALIALAVSLFLYLPVIQSGVVHTIDDRPLVEPLRQIHSLSDYARAVSDGRVFDLNPLRDLTYLADLQLSQLSGHSTLHLTNYLLWLLCLALAYGCFQRLLPTSTHAIAAFLLLLTHPVSVKAVAGVADRKHLLAFVFVLLAVRSTLQEKRGRALLFFALSVLSHPIHLLWPLWWFAHRRLTSGSSFTRIAREGWSLGLIALAGLAANQWYYTGPYLRANLGDAKYLHSTFTLDPSYSLLSFGRYFFQLLVPVQISVFDYLVGDLANLLGLGLLPVFALLVWKFVPRNLRWLGALPFFLPLLLVNVRPTWTFVNDAYLLFPLFGSLLLIVSLLARWLNEKNLLVVASILSLLLLTQTLPLSRAWVSTDAYWQLAYVREPTPKAKLYFAYTLLERKNFREAMRVSLENLDYAPLAQMLFAQAVLEESSIPPHLKERMIREYFVPALPVAYRLAGAQALQGKFSEAYATLQPFADQIGHDPAGADKLGFDLPYLLAADLQFFCESAKAKDCARWDEKFRQDPAVDPAKLQARLAELRLLSR